MPWSLEHCPELFLHLTIVWIIFSLVRNSRMVSEFGISSIPTQEIRGMLDEFHVVNSDDRVYYIQLLQALDLKYMEYIRKVSK